MTSFLKPLRKKPKILKLLSFDVETADKDNDFYMVGIYSASGYKPFYDIDLFYTHLKTHYKNYLCVATNLGFDLTSVFFRSKYWNDFKIVENGGFMLMAENKSQTIKYIDTLNWHKASVKQLGEIVGTPKLSPPPFLGRREPNNYEELITLEEYNKADCEISYKFSVWFQDQILKLGGELKTTIASTSLDVWKRHYNTKTLVKEDFTINKRYKNNNKILTCSIKDKIFNAYYGGRTEVLKRGYYENLNYYDFNSLYPSVMINKLPLPNSVKYIENGSLEEIYNREGVSDITIEHKGSGLPLLPYRHNGKLTFPSGKFRGWYTHIEIRKAIENGYILHKTHETISYSLTFYPFAGYVNDLYDKRLKAKKNGSSEQLIYKLLMNSLYGKFGERKHQVVEHFDIPKMTKKQKDFIEKKELKTFTFDDLGIGYCTWEEECTSSHVFPILPVYITAMARIKLWDKAKDLEPIYMDTDSIVTTHTLPSSNKLGELEQEHHIDKAIFIKPKMYYFKDGEEEVVRMKGVPHASKDQFMQVLKHDTINYAKFVKLKEGIRRKLKVNSVIEISKSLDLEDNKREWILPFSLIPQDSKPIIIKEELEDERGLLQNESCSSIIGETTNKNKSIIPTW